MQKKKKKKKTQKIISLPLDVDLQSGHIHLKNLTEKYLENKS